LKSLQYLYFLEADHGGRDHMQELKMLKQLKKLGIRSVQSAHTKAEEEIPESQNALCAAIGEMKFLESLNITAKAEEEILDLHSLSAPRYLRVINIKARLTRFPDWIPELEYLVKLVLSFSKFEDDPLDSLKRLPNLSRLNLWDDAFSGDCLHFKAGGFPKLQKLDLTRLNRLSSVSIDREALPVLEHFKCNDNPQLKVVPQDLKNLERLQFLGFAEMPAELVGSIEEGGPFHWVINHIPEVEIRLKVESQFRGSRVYHIPTQFIV
jgi:disease resistance protein RPM1